MSWFAAWTRAVGSCALSFSTMMVAESSACAGSGLEEWKLAVNGAVKRPVVPDDSERKRGGSIDVGWIPAAPNGVAIGPGGSRVAGRRLVDSRPAELRPAELIPSGSRRALHRGRAVLRGVRR